MICVSNGANRYLSLISYLREGTSLPGREVEDKGFDKFKFPVPLKKKGKGVP